MRDRRIPENYPLRNLLVSGNLMAAALEHPELLETSEIHQIIATWRGSTEKLRQAEITRQQEAA